MLTLANAALEKCQYKRARQTLDTTHAELIASQHGIRVFRVLSNFVVHFSHLQKVRTEVAHFVQPPVRDFERSMVSVRFQSRRDLIRFELWSTKSAKDSMRFLSYVPS